MKTVGEIANEIYQLLNRYGDSHREDWFYEDAKDVKELIGGAIILIADDVRKQERERCAKILEDEADEVEKWCLDHAPEHRLRDLAERIRSGT